MLHGSQIPDEDSAIRLAKAFLQPMYPTVVAESHVNADRIAGEERQEQLNELISFSESEGLSCAGYARQLGLDEDEFNRYVESEGLSYADLAKQIGLYEDHWRIRFFPTYEAGTASTLGPTIVHIYDSDGRIELKDL